MLWSELKPRQFCKPRVHRLQIGDVSSSAHYDQFKYENLTVAWMEECGGGRVVKQEHQSATFQFILLLLHS